MPPYNLSEKILNSYFVIEIIIASKKMYFFEFISLCDVFLKLPQILC